ncbi:MAG: FAD:protein FMN transferase [Fibrobacterota bacterium]
MNKSFFVKYLSVLLVLAGCRSRKIEEKTFIRMSTVTTIKIAAPLFGLGKDFWIPVDCLLKDYEELYKYHGKNSRIKKINARTSDTVQTGLLLDELIRKAIKYSDTLNGLFDITLMPVKEAWGLNENSTPRVPDTFELKDSLRKTGINRITISEDTGVIIFNDSDIRIDPGGLIKGYVLRSLDSLLLERNLKDYLIICGGDVLVRGKKPDGDHWRIGIRHPRNKKKLLASLPVDKGCIVTSGDYERCFFKDSIRYHHIFDPRSGYPCDLNMSVTVWSPEPVRSDILSTGFFCFPSEKIMEFVNARKNLECLICDSSGTLSVSSGWNGVLKIH